MNKNKELTLRGVLLGALITIILTSSNIFLGLKIGLTIAASIPASIISMFFLKSKNNSNILENNIVQTQSSVAGALSAIVFSIPCLIIIGFWQSINFLLTFFICLSGGVLGVIFTIPLRRTMVVNSNLPYPEGIAAAQILKIPKSNSSDKSNDILDAKTGVSLLTFGGILSTLISLISSALKLVNENLSFYFNIGNKIFSLPIGFSVSMIGAGYLFGISVGISILVGIFISWDILLPFFTSNIALEEGKSLADISYKIWNEKIRLIGVGTISISIIWVVFSFLKPMVNSIKDSISIYKSINLKSNKIDITDLDLSFKYIILIFLFSSICIFCLNFYFLNGSNLSIKLIILLSIIFTFIVIVIGLLMSAASGYMAGLVGTSSSPISGIAIISITFISIILLLCAKIIDDINFVELKNLFLAFAIFLTSMILSVSVISNDNLQDLKTGYLVGATPWKQQLALVIGVFFGSLAIPPMINLLYNAYGFVGAIPHDNMNSHLALSAPQANTLLIIAKNIFNQNIKWFYLNLGFIIGILSIVIDYILRKKTKNLSFPVMAVGLGIYLPPTINMPMVLGSFLNWFILYKIKNQKINNQEIENKLKKINTRGILVASGLIVGESLIAIIIAAIILISMSVGGSQTPFALDYLFSSKIIDLFTIFLILFLMFFIYNKIYKNL